MKLNFKQRKKFWLFTAAVLLAVFLVCQAVFDILVFRGNISLHQGDETILTNLIIKSAESTVKTAPVDAATGRVYLPEAHIYLPPNPQPFSEIRYQYDDFDKANTEIHVTSSTIMNLAEDRLWVAQSPTSWLHRPNTSALFNAVPSLQACTRGVQIFYKAQTDSRLNPGLVLSGSKTLQDGRKLYIYTEPACKEGIGSLADYVKQAQSY